jgi:nitrate reductase NapE component
LAVTVVGSFSRWQFQSLAVTVVGRGFAVWRMIQFFRIPNRSIRESFS